jgi:hypothetical protein
MRPGGLTALAIFNFIFGGLSGLSNLISLATLSQLYEVLAERARASGQEVPSRELLYVLGGFAIVRAALLITAGVGYLTMKRVIGYWFGNAYVILALVSILLEITLAPQKFTAFNLVEFVYPLITLFLLNAVFRKDFSR